MEPIDSRPDVVDINAPTHGQRQISRNRKRQVPWVAIICFVVIAGVAGFGAWKHIIQPNWFPDWGGDKPAPAADVRGNPFEKGSVAYDSRQYDLELDSAQNQVYLEASKRAKDGKFKDLVDAQKWIRINLDKAEQDIGKKYLKPHLFDDLNGDKWDNDKASEIFKGIATGTQ